MIDHASAFASVDSLPPALLAAKFEGDVGAGSFQLRFTQSGSHGTSKTSTGFSEFSNRNVTPFVLYGTREDKSFKGVQGQEQSPYSNVLGVV
jgi:hypothetical protein